MIVAAFLILVIAVLIVVAAVVGGNDRTEVDLGAFVLETTASVVFFLGMATLLLIVLSLAMFRMGAKRAKARREDKKKVSELSSRLDAYKREEERGRPGGTSTSSGSGTSTSTGTSSTSTAPRTPDGPGSSGAPGTP